MTVLLTLAGTHLLSGAPTADAATQGVSTHVDFGDTSYHGTPVLAEGQSATLTLQYDNTVIPGSTVTVKLPANMVLGALPATNTAVSSVSQAADGTVSITFADPFPSDVNQGVLSFGFSLDSIEQSRDTTFEWTLDGQTHSTPLIELNGGDRTQNVQDARSKSVSGSLNGYASLNAGVVTVSPAIIGQPLRYTVQADNANAAPGFSITDQLPAPLSYVAGSFRAQWTTWDANGLNETLGSEQEFTPTITGDSATGEGFSTTFEVPAGSEVDVTYQAAITDDTARLALQARLQAAYDAVVGNVNGGSWQVALTNTATIGDARRSATTTVGGTKAGIPKPNISGVIAKTVDEPVKNIDRTDDNTTLNPPADTVWSFAVNLTMFNGSNPWYTLADNVVLSDTLASQAAWSSDDPDFITTVGNLSLTRAASCTTKAGFAADEFVNQWCVSGQTLLVNLGKDRTLKDTIKARSAITTVAGLPTTSTTVTDATAWTFTNRGYLTYKTLGMGTGPAEEGYSTRPVTLVDRGDDLGWGFNDETVFSKTSPAELSITPGTSATIPYTFTVAAGKGFDVRELTVVDRVDEEIFDLTDLDAIAATLSGSYQGIALGSADFTLTRSPDGYLLINLSEDGKAKVTAPDKKYVVRLDLTTRAVIGKQTEAVDNQAWIRTLSNGREYWSTTTSTVTSFGDEAEVTKSVWDPAQAEWTNNLRAPIDPSGHLEHDTYVYRVQFLPHGGYDNVRIVDVDDVLPAGLEFVGFIDGNDADSQANPSTQTRDIGGNIEASWDAAARTVTLGQSDGTRLDADADIAAYFVVKIASYEPEETIVNRIGQVSASITPTDSYPVSVVKKDATDQSAVIDDPDARFRLVDEDGAVVVDQIFVHDGDLRVLSPDGEPAAVTVPRPGTYHLTEVKAPAGYVKSSETLRVVVGAGGSEQEQFFNTPAAPSVAVGNHVWIDTNRDGLQDDTDQPLAGVVLTLTGPDGAPVTGVDGEPVGPRTTDAEGHYLFTGLPVLATGQGYTVTIDRAASQAALTGLTPTTPQAGTDRAVDSSTDSATSAADLSKGGAEDLTLDFGFVRPAPTPSTEPTSTEPTATAPTTTPTTVPSDQPSDQPSPSGDVEATETGSTPSDTPDPTAPATGAATDPGAGASAVGGIGDDGDSTTLPATGLALGLSALLAGLLALLAGFFLLTRTPSRSRRH